MLSAAQLREAVLRMLARREHSRAEIRRRLGPRAESAEQLDAVLDALAGEGLLSEERFAESLARRRAQRFGAARLAHEMQQHGLDPSIANPLIAEARTSERERAFQVWVKRFGKVATSLPEKARQYRFLAQRGFSGDTVNWVLREAAARHAVREGESGVSER